MPGGATLTGPTKSVRFRLSDKQTAPTVGRVRRSRHPANRTTYFFRVHAMVQWEPTPGSNWLAPAAY
ncbi:hypothetical protein ES815_12280 [Leclercia adecarboxylata]|uniref:Uncharacterized protein n=1 Tax=Leclercia adecarboxylata TaxID=83655 RepID=A0AAP9DBB4_9ENTR|nr:hypothetical protein ES815_12280 [Leclercia adecarboxylata]